MQAWLTGPGGHDQSRPLILKWREHLPVDTELTACWAPPGDLVPNKHSFLHLLFKLTATFSKCLIEVCIIDVFIFKMKSASIIELIE